MGRRGERLATADGRISGTGPGLLTGTETPPITGIIGLLDADEPLDTPACSGGSRWSNAWVDSVK
jgi:hypothetical protein